MRFQELKRIEDYKEIFARLQQANIATNDKTNWVFEEKRKLVKTRTFEDFTRFFTENGFSVDSHGEEATAIYKSLNIKLKVDDPGRRKEDIPCLMRFLLFFAGPADEAYAVFVQHGNNGEDNRREPMQPKTLPFGIAGEIQQELREQMVQATRLMSMTQEALTEFQNRGNLAHVENLHDLVKDFRSQVAMSLERWTDIQRDHYVYLAVRNEDVWQPDALDVYTSMYLFLKTLA